MSAAKAPSPTLLEASNLSKLPTTLFHPPILARVLWRAIIRVVQPGRR